MRYTLRVLVPWSYLCASLRVYYYAFLLSCGVTGRDTWDTTLFTLPEGRPQEGTSCIHRGHPLTHPTIHLRKDNICNPPFKQCGDPLPRFEVCVRGVSLQVLISTRLHNQRQLGTSN
ncbi:hypothetical protein EDB87DRAFT_1643539 [Lactarius vividus]|nr:hypothetical protein EDB87DRAFT_1643539 [Lactarius vividus]